MLEKKYFLITLAIVCAVVIATTIGFVQGRYQGTLLGEKEGRFLAQQNSPTLSLSLSNITIKSSLMNLISDDDVIEKTLKKGLGDRPMGYFTYHLQVRMQAVQVKNSNKSLDIVLKKPVVNNIEILTVQDMAQK